MIHRKTQVLRRGRGLHEKPIYRRGLPRLGQFAASRKGLGKKERGWCF